MAHLRAFLLLGFLLVATVPLINPVCASSATHYGAVVVDSNYWQFPNNALSAPDDLNARCSTDGGGIFINFANFSFSGSIDYVEIGFKSCVSISGERHSLHLWVPEDYKYCGYANTPVNGFPYDTEWHYFNETADSVPLKDFLNTVAKLNNVELEVRHSTGGGSPPPPCIPWTSYLDAVSIYVEYTEGAEEVDCNWIGTSSSVGGQVATLSADFTDINQTYGLSHSRLLHNNTGSFVNGSWLSTWVRGNWTERTVTLNRTVGLVVAFRYFVNDSSGTEHQSTICFFTLAEPFVEFKVRGGAGTPITWYMYLWNILRGASMSYEGRVIIAVAFSGGLVLGVVLFRRKPERRTLTVKRVETS